MAIAWDPGLADDDLWGRLHEHFTEPQLIELGHFIALTLGQQRFLKTVGVRHGEILADNDAGLAPEEAASAARQPADSGDRLTYQVTRSAGPHWPAPTASLRKIAVVFGDRSANS